MPFDGEEGLPYARAAGAGHDEPAVREAPRDFSQRPLFGLFLAWNGSAGFHAY